MDPTVPKTGSGANRPRARSANLPDARQRQELEDALLRAHGLTRAQVPDGFLRVALIRVTAGQLPLDAPELKQLFKPFQHGVHRASASRVRRERGQAPSGVPIEERRKRVFVRGLCRFLARLNGPRDGAPAPQKSRVSAERVPLHPGASERHPRAAQACLVKLHGAQDAQLVAELEQQLVQGPDQDRRRPLPDDLAGSPSTQRRMRRRQQARRALARQLGRSSAERQQDPGPMKPLPLHEGRMVARMLRDPREALRFFRTLPPQVRHQLTKAARYRTSERLRAPYADTVLHIAAWYAFLLHCSASPRHRRAGFDRAVEGLCREALAAAFPANPDTAAPFDANSLSNWTRALEQFGLVLREQPNRGQDVYRGPTGWALNVYRMPNGVQLSALLKSAETAVPFEAPSPDRERPPQPPPDS